MTVYVDDARIPTKVGRLQSNWSHLMADSREELIGFAASLGLKASWLQDKPSGVHFDVTDSIRHKAIKAGAVPIECRSEEWFRVVGVARRQYARDSLRYGGVMNDE